MTLKIYIESGSMAPAQLNHELNMYSRVNAGPNSHPGKEAVRSLLDSFKIDRRADKKHEYLVDTPSWENVWALLHRNPIQRLPSPVLAFVLHRLFLALDYLHTECNMIHTGVCCRNIVTNSSLGMANQFVDKISKQTISCSVSSMNPF